MFRVTRLIVLALALGLVAAPISAVMSPLAQACDGCRPTTTAYLGNAEYFTLEPLSFVSIEGLMGSGTCGMSYNPETGETICASAPCQGSVTAIVVGMAPGSSFNECTSSTSTPTREDCETPSKTTDAFGNYTTPDTEAIVTLTCGSGTQFYTISVPQGSAQIQFECTACKQ